MATQSKEPAAEAPVNAGLHAASDRLNVAAYVVRQLGEWGVAHVYGVIGDAVFGLLDAIAGQTQVRYIGCKHEEAAALMASAEAKLTGRLAVCVATSGPGVANLVNGLADAAADRAPVLAITGQVDTPRIGTNTKQYIDQQRLLAAVAGTSELLAHADALPELLRRMLARCMLHGEVAHLAIPRDLYAMPVQGVIAPYPAYLHQPLLAPDEPVAAAIALLRQAERPALYIGRGAAAAAEQLVPLADRLSAAVVATLPARALFPNGHELFAGGLGQAGSEAASALLAESDLVLMLGATWWPDGYAPALARIVQIDLSAVNIGMTHAVQIGVVGDARTIVPRLLSGIGGGERDRAAWRRRVGDVCAAWKRRIAAEAEANDAAPMAPQRVIAAVAAHAPDDAIIALDTGDHTLWFDRVFAANQQTILLSGRWRTLGFALPAAIAAQLAEPYRRAIAIAGDGGVVQTLLEFQTAAAYRLPIVLIVLNNGCYAMERNRMLAGGMVPLGSRLDNPDFAAIAAACGGAGWRAESAAELELSLRSALGQRKPALIDVRTADTPVPHSQP